MKKFIRCFKGSKVIAPFVCFFIISLACSLRGIAQNGIATYTFETSQPTTAGPFNPEFGSGIVSGSSGPTFTSNVGNGSANSYIGTNWNPNNYFQFEVNTTGYKNITIQFDQTGSASGPANFELQYSTSAAGPFTNVAAYTVIKNGAGSLLIWSASTYATGYTYNFSLSTFTALNNNATVYFRLEDLNTTSINGGTVAAGGTSKIDNVIIRGTLNASAFTPGNIAIYHVGDGIQTLAATGNTVYLDEYTTAGTLVQSVPMPDSISGNNQGLVASGGAVTAASEGQMNLSQNGQYLSMLGYGLTSGSTIASQSATVIPRVAGLVSSAPSINTSVFFNTAGGFADAVNPRGAVSNDGSELWLTCAAGTGGGVQYVSGTSGTGTGATTTVLNTAFLNTRGVNLAYDITQATPQYQLFFSSQSGNGGSGNRGVITTMGTGEPTTSEQTTNNYPDSASPAAPNGFVFLTVGSTPVVYFANSEGWINKYIYTGSAWVASGTSAAANIYGLTGTVVDSTVFLYATGSGASGTSGTLYSLTDASANTSSLSAAATAIATAGANIAFRSPAFVPLATAISITNPGNQSFNGISTPESVTINSSAHTTVEYVISGSTIAGLSNGTIGSGTAGAGTGAVSFTPTSAGTATVTTYAYYGDKTTVPVSFTITVTRPTILPASTTLAAMVTTYGTASAAKTVSITGTHLTGNITTSAAPTGFEVSSDGTNYGSTATFTQSGGNASGTLYIRLAATATVGGTYNGQIITLSSSGAANATVTTAASGNVVGAATLVITASANSKIYGTSVSTTGVLNSTFTVSGLQGTDAVSSVTLAFSGNPKGNLVTAAVGSYTITPSAPVFSTGSASNYNVGFTTGTLTVNPASVTASLTGTVSKVYDGTNTATLTTANYSLSGLLNGDLPTVSNTAGTYSTTSVGTGITVTVTSLVLSGTTAGNYTVSNAASVNGAIGTITAASLTASLTGIVSKVYDGTGTATLTTANYSLSGVVSGDAGNVVVTNTSGSYINKNVGTSKKVTVTSLVLGGSAAGNYTLSNAASINATIGTITAAPLTASLTGTVSKTYDGTTTATLTTTNYSLSGVVGAENVTVTNTSGTYSSASVGTGITVTVTSLVLGGTAASNYTLSNAASVSGAVGTITALSITASLTGTISKVYDGTTAASNLTSTNYTLTGVLAGDAANVKVTSTSGTYSITNVGTGITVTVASPVLGGSAGGNYTVTGSATGAIGTITALSITVGSSLIGTVSKVYDGTKNATLTPANYTLNGVLGGDVGNVTVATTNGTYTGGSGKDVGTGKTVSVSNLTLGGSAGGNYTLTNAAGPITGAIGTITAKSLTVSLTGTVSKVYDGTTSATLTSSNYSLSGVVAADAGNVIVTTTSGNYSTANVGTGLTVTVNSMALGGSAASNYSLSNSSSVSGAVGTITAVSITASLTGTVSKTYDGTTTATLATTNYSLSGVLALDASKVTVTNTSGTYDTKNVGTGKTVTVTALVLGGTAAGNYTLSNASSVSGAVGTILSKSLTVTATGVNKVYDGTTAATVNLSDNRVAGDNITDNYTSASFSDKNVGNGKTVSVSGISISGPDAGNYTLSNTTATTTANITAASLTVTATGVNKVYDGTTAATVTLSDNRAAGDNITDNYTSASFSDKNVGNGKTVSVSGISISGPDAGNYTLNNTTATTTANITAVTLTVTATGVNKVYDGTTAATVTLSDNRAAGDNITDNYTSASFSDKNVGNGKTVSVSGISISGPDAGNYTLSNTTATTTANITAASLTVTATGVNKVYDGTTAATVTLSDNRAAGDNITDNYTSASFSDKNVGNGKTVSVSGISISGPDAGNYTLSNTTATTTANITGASLTVTATGVNKVYDGTTAATVTLSDNRAAGDNITDNYTSASFSDKNVGNGKTVSVSGISISGPDAGNYTLSNTTATTTANITGASLTVTATGVNKVYDGTTAATVTLSDNRAAGDNITDNYTSASFSDKNVGNGKAVSVSGISISGPDAGNYTLSNTTATTTANITGAALTVTATGVNKVYDGTTAATVTLSDNRVAGDNITDNYTSASFSDKNVGNGKTVSVSGISISGPDAGNYTLSNTTATTTANITAASLTITANNITKCNGATYTFAGTEFTTAGLAAVDAVSSVTLASAGAAAGAAAGPYSITPSAAVGTGLANYTIVYTNGTMTVEAPIAVTLTQVNPDCHGNPGSLTTNTVTGGTSPYTYKVNPGAFNPSGTYVSNPLFGSLSTGGYTYAVKDVYGCIGTQGAILSQLTKEPVLINSATAPASVAICYGGTTTITTNAAGGNPAFTYTLNTNGTNGTAQQAANRYFQVGAGSYYIIVTDSHGCTYNTDTIAVTQPSTALSFTSAVTTSIVSCTSSSSTIKVTAAGGYSSSYTYSDNNGSSYQAGNSFAGLAPTVQTVYNLVVKDANGCTANGSATVQAVSQYVLSSSAITGNTQACYGGTTTITTTPSGGTPPYLYSLDNGSFVSSSQRYFATVTPGSHTITVKDNIGCTYTPPAIVITQPSQRKLYSSNNECELCKQHRQHHDNSSRRLWRLQLQREQRQHLPVLEQLYRAWSRDV